MAETGQHTAPLAQQKSGRTARSETKAYLVGAGIASLASAAYLIREGGVEGRNICIYEETEVIGGSLDGEGLPDHNYVIRGGRMFTEEAYTCTFDLLSFIPSLATPGKFVKEEIVQFNSMVKSYSHARLVRDGRKIDSSAIGLSNKDRLDLIAIIAPRTPTGLCLSCCPTSRTSSINPKASTSFGAMAYFQTRRATTSRRRCRIAPVKKSLWSFGTICASTIRFL